MGFCLRPLVAAAILGAFWPAATSLLAQQTPSANSAPASKAPATAPPATSLAPAAAPPAAQPKPAKPSSADDNPFPEEQSQAAQKEATEQEHADRKAAASGSAVDGAPAETGSSSRDKLAGVDILGDHESRISNGAGGTIVDPKLSAQDVKVGQQYLGIGNYQGAYERFKEACLVNPANVDAVFYLAEAARRTAHLDESAENYRIYLEAQPDGSKAKAARKALAQLTGK